MVAEVVKTSSFFFTLKEFYIFKIMCILIVIYIILIHWTYMLECFNYVSSYWNEKFSLKKYFRLTFIPVIIIGLLNKIQNYMPWFVMCRKCSYSEHCTLVVLAWGAYLFTYEIWESNRRYKNKLGSKYLFGCW